MEQHELRRRPPYPYVQCIRDRRGHPHAYLRKPGLPRIALPLPVGSRAFVEAYQAAPEAPPAPVMGKAKPRSIAALVDLYCHSRKWTDLAPSSQRSYRYVLGPFVAEHGHRSCVQMEAKHVDAIMDAMVGTPVQANRLRKLLSRMMRMAIRQGWRKDNPAAVCDNFKIKSKGHRPWSVEEIAAFEATYPIGSDERLAFALLLYTGQRVSDVVRMGRQHAKDGVITIKQKKSGVTVEVSIPIRPELKVVLDEVQSRRIAPTFLLNQYGKARSAAGLSTMFGQWCEKAGLPADAHAHGLRKSFNTDAAEAGCTPHEIMALSGHKTLAEVEPTPPPPIARGWPRAAWRRSKSEQAMETRSKGLQKTRANPMKLKDKIMSLGNLNGSSRAAGHAGESSTYLESRQCP
jgi:integrase